MKHVLIILIAILPFSVLAQSNYYPGYVVKNNGDTVKGYINYHEWSVSPHAVDFKINKADKDIQTFDPQAIKEFGINGLEVYTSYTGIISTGQTNFSNLHHGIDTGKMIDNVFLKQIANGRHLRLYYHGDNIKTRYFISETNGAPVELNYYQYISESSEVTKSSIFKGQLILYANKFKPGNDKLVNKIEQSDYNTDDLQNIVNDINDAKITTRKKPSTRLFIGAGVAYTSTETANTSANTGVQKSTSVFPKISAGIDVFGNPNVQQLVFRGELTLFYTNPSFPQTQISGGSTYGPISFSQYTAAFTPQLLFNFYNKDKIKVYLDAGIGLNLSAYSNNKVLFGDFSFTYNTFWVNVPLQLGVLVNKKVEICFTYSSYAPYTGYDFFYIKSQSTSLGVKYLFGK